jgi:hypothetical protein
MGRSDDDDDDDGCIGITNRRCRLLRREIRTKDGRSLRTIASRTETVVVLVAEKSYRFVAWTNHSRRGVVVSVCGVLHFLDLLFMTKHSSSLYMPLLSWLSLSQRIALCSLNH